MDSKLILIVIYVYMVVTLLTCNCIVYSLKNNFPNQDNQNMKYLDNIFLASPAVNHTSGLLVY